MPILEYRCKDCSAKFEILHLSKKIGRYYLSKMSF